MYKLDLTDAEVQALAQTTTRQALLDEIAATFESPYYSFRPRPNRPEEWDEQEAFVYSKAKFAICLGGNGSGKTAAAAFRTVNYLANQKPFRERCPFWVIGESFELCCGVCWVEKLSNLIPPEWIADISWNDQKRQWPAEVMLKHPDDPSKIGWVLVFKSFAQGREKMQGFSIGGYWFNEQVPMTIVEEVHGRCREYDSPGWADFTPLKIDSHEWPEAYEDPPEGWSFYHLNVEKNSALPEGWAARYLATVSEDIRETRRTGAFSSFRGQVFKEWNNKVHVIDPFIDDPEKEYGIPKDWRKLRSLDFGFYNPFCCLWGAKDHDGRYYIYDEHYASEQLNAYHARKIKERKWDENDPHYGQTYSDHDAQARAELANLGIFCTPAKKDILRGIDMLRSYLMIQDDGKPRLYVFRHCTNLIREMKSYKWPDGTNTKNPKDLPLDKDNHAVDGLRYLIHSDNVRTNGAPKPVNAPWKPKGGMRFRPNGR